MALGSSRLRRVGCGERDPSQTPSQLQPPGRQGVPDCVLRDCGCVTAAFTLTRLCSIHWRCPSADELLPLAQCITLPTHLPHH